MLPSPLAMPCTPTEPALPACSLQQLPPTHMCTVPSPAGIHIRTHIQSLCFPPSSCSVSAMYSLTQQCSAPVLHAHPRAPRAPTPLLAALYAQPALPPLLHAQTLPSSALPASPWQCLPPAASTRSRLHTAISPPTHPPGHLRPLLHVQPPSTSHPAADTAAVSRSDSHSHGCTSTRTHTHTNMSCT